MAASGRANIFVHKLFKIHKYAKTQSELNDGVIDWDVVHGQCVRSKPDYPQDFALMMKYVQLWSGGADDPVLLKMLQDSLRFVDNIRVVRGGVFKQLGELELGPGKGGLLRTAVVMAMAGCLAACNASGEAALYKSTDMSSMGKTNKALAMQVDNLFEQLVTLYKDSSTI